MSCWGEVWSDTVCELYSAVVAKWCLNAVLTLRCVFSNKERDVIECDEDLKLEHNLVRLQL